MPWHAIFNDGTVLDQFNSQGQERIFKHVLDRLQDLTHLSIIQNGLEFRVSMSDGLFSIHRGNEQWLEFYAVSGDRYHLDNFRPIYFRREEASLTLNSPISGKVTVQFEAIGWQANLEGKNIKRYLAVKSDGSFTIRDQ